MRPWAACTILLYLVLFTVIILILNLLPAKLGTELAPFAAYLTLSLPFLLLIQGALLLIPATAAKGRPVKRRHVIVSAAIIALPMTLLVVLFVWALMVIAFPEGDPASALSPKARVLWDNVTPQWFVLLLIGAVWVFWGLLFHSFYSHEKPRAFTSKVVTCLLTGSLLELLVAIPSHIIARHRHDCCAPLTTTFGLAAGLSIALLAFGPTLFLLFARRIQEKNSRKTPPAKTLHE